MLQLTIRFDDERQTQVFAIDGETTIGRHSDNRLRIKDTFLSAFHAEIRRSPQGGYEVIDLDSFNGTFVNGLRIRQHPLRAGDELMLGTLPGKVTERGIMADFSDSNAITKTQPTIVSLNDRGISPHEGLSGRKAQSSPAALEPTQSQAVAPVAVPGPAKTELAERSRQPSPKLSIKPRNCVSITS